MGVRSRWGPPELQECSRGPRRASGHKQQGCHICPAAPAAPDIWGPNEAARTFQEAPAESPDKADMDVKNVRRRLRPRWSPNEAPRKLQESPAGPPDKTDMEVRIVRRRLRFPVGPRQDSKSVPGGPRRASGQNQQGCQICPAAPAAPDGSTRRLQERYRRAPQILWTCGLR